MLKTIKNFFRKESRTRQIVSSTNLQSAAWSDHKYESYAKEAYLKNVIAFRCIDLIGKSVASVDWDIYTKNKDGEKVEDEVHPYNKLLHRPNPDQSFEAFISMTLAYLLLDGNGFVERVAPDTGPARGITRELYSLRPDKIDIKLNSRGRVESYIYKQNNGTVTYDVNPMTGQADLLHVKLFHPLNEYRGCSPIQSLSHSIDTSNESSEWNMRLLQNDARPGMIFSYDGALSDQQYDRLVKQIQDKYSGSANAGRNLLLEGPEGQHPEIKAYGMAPKEMDWLEGSRESARRIAFGLGVPPQLVGIPGDTTFANYKEARRAFWEDTVVYYLNLFKGEFNNWLFEPGSLSSIGYDLDSIPAMQDKRNDLYTVLQGVDFLTLNEKREKVGYSPIDGGDVLLIPSGLIPIEDAAITAEEIPGEEIPPDDMPME